MINNFDKFDFVWKEGEFYFFQIIKRAKDNPGVAGINGNNHARCIKEYSIYTQDDLLKRTREMIDIATATNSRIYMHPARRSEEVIKRLMVLLLGEHIALGRHRLKALYSHACGFAQGTERMRIVDVDEGSGDLNKIGMTINTIRPEGQKILQTIQTKNGLHLITKPFDLQVFKTIFPKIDVHKNNPTLLFVP